MIYDICLYIICFITILKNSNRKPHLKGSRSTLCTPFTSFNTEIYLYFAPFLHSVIQSLYSSSSSWKQQLEFDFRDKKMWATLKVLFHVSPETKLLEGGYPVAKWSMGLAHPLHCSPVILQVFLPGKGWKYQQSEWDVNSACNLFPSLNNRWFGCISRFW